MYIYIYIYMYVFVLRILFTSGTTLIPLLGGTAAEITVTEGSPPVPVWQGGKYASGVLGVTGATASADGIAIEHGSGTYSFTRTG